jgi:hypothetical protein
MNITVSLLESSADIKDQILVAIKNHIESKLPKASKAATDKIHPLIIKGLKEEPEYQSLVGGDLRLGMGIADSSKVDDIIEKLASTISIENKPITIGSNGLLGGFVITAIHSENFNGLLTDDSAVVVDTEKGYSLPWLDWLLLQGNKTIITDYTMKVGPNPNSRTGMAIMVESDRNWRVPPSFAGTKTNNWTTRAIQRIQKEVENIILKEVEKII